MREAQYEQKSGVFRVRNEDGTYTRLGKGYSGAPPYVNDPQSEALVARGVIPRGRYKLVGPFDQFALGPVCFYLAPAPGNVMHGRSGFFIHGDNAEKNHTASHGCIVLSRSARMWIAGNLVGELEVV
jgi:hypothetical protein